MRSKKDPKLTPAGNRVIRAIRNGTLFNARDHQTDNAQTPFSGEFSDDFESPTPPQLAKVLREQSIK